jgi:hypothetical protein
LKREPEQRLMRDISSSLTGRQERFVNGSWANLGQPGRSREGELWG